MSEFDATGFSVINTFFGRDSKDDDTGDAKKVSSQPKGKRRGVGTSAPPKTVQTDLTKKLLNVGRKRRRGGDDDEEDEIHDEIQEEDEEAGRTAIFGNVTQSNKPAADALLNTSKQKKRLGKKERNQNTHDQKEAEKTESKKEYQVDSLEASKDTSEIAHVEGEVLSGDVEMTQKKNKRRKVRSKQKNIRKDNRENKPEHLVVGRKRYQGRPLTSETRAKLHLPSPKVRTPYILESSYETGDSEVVPETGLAIDDLLEDTGKQVGTEQPELVKEKTSKKRRKSKYKNLKL